jgi:UDP-glucose 4-epimerase
VAYWLEAAAKGEPLVLLGHQNTVRDFVYIGDIVSALVAADQRRTELPPVINIGSGQPTTLAELARTVLAVVDDPELEFRAKPPRDFDLSRTWLDVSRAREALGWQPTSDLRTGVAAAWAAISRRAGEGASSPAAQLARRRP